MLSIEKFDIHNNYRILQLDDHIFHNALIKVSEGDKRFHVANPLGEDFDLIYTDNDKAVKNEDDYRSNTFLNRIRFYPSYLTYDEYDESRLCLEIFDAYDTVCFDSLNEYTITIAKVLLEISDRKVIFEDDRIAWFLGKYDNLIIGNDSHLNDGKCMHVIDHFTSGSLYNNFDVVWSITLFHNVFLLQWLTPYPMDQIKYVEVTVPKTEGIGSLIHNMLRIEKFFLKFGCVTYIKPQSSRYSDQMLKNYFNLAEEIKDAGEENTICVESFFTLILTYSVMSIIPKLDTSILNPHFLKHLKEYGDAVIGKKRMLGVIIRGTDFILSGFAVMPLPLEIVIDMIGERLNQYHYDGFFLATEDADYFEGLRKAFPDKMVSVSQERFRVSEFKNAHLISELEKEKKGGDEYNAMVEDTTINYFYAIYMLSICESLFSTPECHATHMAQSFNGGNYVHAECCGMENGKIVTLYSY